MVQAPHQYPRHLAFNSAYPRLALAGRSERFRAQGDAPARIAELAKASSWEQGNVVEKSGYAVMPGSKTTDSDVARACAEILATPAVPKS